MNSYTDEPQNLLTIIRTAGAGEEVEGRKVESLYLNRWGD
jgi:hypothetical protein